MLDALRRGRVNVVMWALVVAIAAIAAYLLLTQPDGDADVPPPGVRATPPRQSALVDGRASVVVGPASRPTTVSLTLDDGEEAALRPTVARLVVAPSPRKRTVALRISSFGRELARSCTPMTLVATVDDGGERANAAEAAVRSSEALCPDGEAVAPDAGRFVASQASPNPSELGDLPFDRRSHWLQPWQAWTDTVPAGRLLRAIGINLNVADAEVAGTAELLGRSGVRRARLEVGWDRVSFDHPDRLADPAALQRTVSALKRNRIRPLILLNANETSPGPNRATPLTLARPARTGARTVRLTTASARQVRAGLTGFDRLTGDRVAEVLVQRVAADGTALLSRPLPVPLTAGEHAATTLRFAPFQAPQLPGGGANPAFERTMRGWLEYVGAVTRAVREALGTDDFDVEVWNELSFGSAFLDASQYYQPIPAATGSVTDALLRRTVAYLRDDEHGVADVGIGDGFANQTPFAAASTSPPGLTALDKHPYAGAQRFPGATTAANVRPVDALGKPDGRRVDGRWRDSFVPRYRAFFPEYYLTGIQTETLLRDLSPTPERFGGAVHGRSVAPPGGSPPGMWITEYGIDPTGADPSDPSRRAAGSGSLSAADVERLQAKVALRTLVSYVNKGISQVDLYAAKGTDFGLIEPAFFRGLADGRVDDAAAGLTMQAIRRMTAVFGSPKPLGRTDPLRLVSASSSSDAREFAGDGTRGHPSLYDRDLLAFFPFEAAPGRWVAPLYVMTRDVAAVRNADAGASSPRRLDLRPQTFRLRLRGVEADQARVSYYDPLNGRYAPVQVESREGEEVVVRVQATDSPRLLVVSDI